jgi:cell division protein FtsA
VAPPNRIQADHTQADRNQNSGKRRKSARPRLRADEQLVTVLDIGTSKIVCLMAAVQQSSSVADRAGAPTMRIVGCGYQRSAGVRAGMITALAEAERAVKATIEEAEEQSGLQVEDVLAAVSCGRPRTETFVATAPVRGRTVAEADLAYARQAAGRYAERDGRALLHLNEHSFRLDGAGEIDNPRGMPGDRLGLAVSAITADALELRNIETLIGHCYLEPAGYIATAFASGLATLTSDERDIGAIVVDLGAGTTSFGVFTSGNLTYADAIPSGGDHITLDIAKALSTSRTHAERIKTLYGTVLSANSDATEPINYATAGASLADDAAETERTTRADLRAIIAPRVDLVLGEVKSRLAAAGLLDAAATGIVLTGGAAQLQGLAGFASSLFGQPVRLAEPYQRLGMPEPASPMFSAVLGALAARAAPNVTIGRTLLDVNSGMVAGEDGYLASVGRWLKVSFWDDERSREAL